MICLIGVAILVPERTFAQITITRSIAASSDDAEEAGPDATGTHLPGHMDRTSSDIELVQDFDGTGGYSGGTQKIGLRFTALSIPPGSIITSAYLTFRAVAADAPMSNSGATNLTIQGHLTANAPTFPSTNGDISARALSASSVSWVPAAWTTGTDVNSPSIVPVIQEIVDQGGWASGNAIAIIITGTGHRASQAYDTDPATAARLTVTYATYQISGTVFEDVNYGGGAGRNLATATGAGGTGRSGARVELFDNAGNYVTFTTTAAGGTYSFSGLAPGSYTVRVVNSSVISARTGYLAGTHLAVQTFRTNASTGAAVAVTNYVGGEVPGKADAGNGSTTLAALTTGTTAPQSITPVTIGSSDVTGVDFGYSFNVVCNRNNTGQGSLRQFITNANALSNAGLAIQGRTAGIDHAIFMLADGTNSFAGMNSGQANLFTSGVATITAASALPDITQPVVIDAQTQPGFVSTPKFELNGNNVAGALKGFRLIAGSTGSTIRGFIINRWTGHGIEVNGSNNHVIAGNWIGLGSTGLAASANAQNGIRLTNSSGILIGGTSALSHNVISGNTQQGIYGDNLDNSTISGNYIGTDANGTGDVNGTVANTFLSGIYLINGSNDNVIGGTTPGSGNVLSGNNHFGFEVLFGSQNNLLQGNYIGTDATGLVALGNVNGGAAFWSAGTGNVFGGGVDAARNVISGNLSNGVLVSNASAGATIQGNYIGIGADGITPIGNGSAGVKVEGGSTNTLIGTDANGTNDAGERNVISGNSGDGIVLSGATVTATIIAGNYIGTASSGNTAMPNTLAGISLNSGTNSNTIGGTTAAARNIVAGNAQGGIDIDGSNGNTVAGNYIGLGANGSTAINNASEAMTINNGASNNIIGGTTSASRNVICGSASTGILLSGATTTGNQFLNNYIGTDATGTLSRPCLSAFYVDGSPNNIFGAAGQGNVISGNTYHGIVFDLAGSNGNTVRGNIIGLNASGTAALPNGAMGILLRTSSHDNIIGGTVAGQRNLLSANGGNGISLESPSPNNLIQGNYIGTDITGNLDFGNASNGILCQAANNTIGGTAAGARNVISGNNSHGIRIEGTTGITVQGNIIGLNAAGTAAIRNEANGITLNGGGGHLIGGGTASARNIISGQTNSGTSADGIYITGSAGNTIQGNYIGTDITGAVALGNYSAGIACDGNNNLIGGIVAGEGNLIANNGFFGVRIGGTGNRVLRNSINSNPGGLGIDLNNDGVTTNDVNDGDGGANTLQNYPVLGSAVSSGGNTTIIGTLNSTASTTFRIEFFSSPTADPSTYGEGAVYLGTTDVTTNASSNAPINALLPGVSVAAGHFVSATATNAANNNTSEFSQNVVASQAPVAVCQNITVDLDGAGSASITAAQVDGGSTDDIGIVSYSVSPNSFTCANIGANNVTLTVTDGAGNQSSCVAAVTVRDVIPPNMTCPADIVVQVDQGVTSAVATYTAPTATDNCGSAVVSLFSGNASGSSFPLGNSIVVYQATDAAGNVTRCGFNVTVMTCPANIVLPAQPGLCGSTATWSNLSMIHNEGFEGPASGIGGTGWNAANSSVTRVTSGTNGITSASGAYHLSIDPAASPTTGAFTRLGGSRKCFGGGFSTSIDVYMDLSDPRVIANTYGWDNTGAIHDNNGVYLRDFLFQTASNASGHILVGAGNNSGGTRRTDLAMFPNYEIISSGWYTFKRIYRAQAGALAVDFEVRNAGGALLWTTTLSNPADLIANIGGNRSLWFIFLETGKLAVDNCRLTYNNESESIDHASGSFFPVGSTTVTNTSTTPCGTVLTCAFQVIVNDTQAPSISCPANISVGSGPGICGAVVSYTVPAGTDNCAGVTTTRTAGLASGSVFPPGTTTVTYRATDASGNITTCSFTVTVTPTDNDADGVCDNVDLDDDNDGIPDTAEGGAALDTDADGVPNRFDLDSDNDGIYDCVESGSAQSFTAGVLNGAVTANGIPVSVDANANGVVDYTIRDSDADSTIDSLELDADADGCTDVIEAGYTDANSDGRLGPVPLTVDARGLVTSGNN